MSENPKSVGPRDVKADLIFELAAPVVCEWLSKISGIPLDVLNGGEYNLTRAIYLNKSFKRFYEVKAIVTETPRTFSLNNDTPKELLEALGAIIYAVKAVFASFISTIQVPDQFQEQAKILKNIGLALDNSTNTFYAKYIDPNLAHREYLGISLDKLLHQQNIEAQEHHDKPDKVWYKTLDEFNAIDKKIKEERLEEKADEITNLWKNKARIAITFDVVSEAEIPHHYRISTLPKFVDAQYMDTDHKSME